MSILWIVGYDFSECSRAALETAATDLGAGSGGSLMLAYVEASPHVALGPGLHPSDPLFQRVEEASAGISARRRSLLDEVVSSVAARHPTVDISATITVGNPAEGLVSFAEAQGADRIVVGTRGHLGFKRFVLGSVAARVLRMSRLPVLVVHADDDCGPAVGQAAPDDAPFD